MAYENTNHHRRSRSRRLLCLLIYLGHADVYAIRRRVHLVICRANGRLRELTHVTGAAMSQEDQRRILWELHNLVVDAIAVIDEKLALLLEHGRQVEN